MSNDPYYDDEWYEDDEWDDDDEYGYSMGTCRSCGDALSAEEADYQDGYCTTCYRAIPDDLNAVWEDDWDDVEGYIPF